ncbi:MAG: hypothetical protein ABJQ70_21840 [Roseobacter sp.]
MTLALRSTPRAESCHSLRLMLKNPYELLTMPKANQPRDRVETRKELELLLSAMSTSINDLIGLDRNYPIDYCDEQLRRPVQNPGYVKPRNPEKSDFGFNPKFHCG